MQTEEEKVEPIKELDDGRFEATCQCGWKSGPKTERLSAKRSWSGHQKTCRVHAKVGETPSEKAEEEAEQPQYVGDLRTVAEILHRFGVSKTLAPRILDSIQKRPQYLDSPFELESLLESQRVRGERTIRLITMEVFEELNPQALRGYGSMTEFQPGGTSPRREFYQDEGDREEMKEKDRAIADLTEKVHALELTILKTDMDGKLALRDDRIGRLEAAVSQTPTGKNIYDLADKVTDKVDHGVDRIIDKLGKPTGEFKPEVKRTPQQRLQVAGDIQRQLEQKERILQAENELLIAAAED